MKQISSHLGQQIVLLSPLVRVPVYGVRAARFSGQLPKVLVRMWSGEQLAERITPTPLLRDHPQ